MLLWGAAADVVGAAVTVVGGAGGGGVRRGVKQRREIDRGGRTGFRVEAHVNRRAHSGDLLGATGRRRHSGATTSTSGGRDALMEHTRYDPLILIHQNTTISSQ